MIAIVRRLQGISGTPRQDNDIRLPLYARRVGCQCEVLRGELFGIPFAGFALALPAVRGTAACGSAWPLPFCFSFRGVFCRGTIFSAYWYVPLMGAAIARPLRRMPVSVCRPPYSSPLGCPGTTSICAITSTKSWPRRRQPRIRRRSCEPPLVCCRVFEYSSITACRARLLPGGCGSIELFADGQKIQMYPIGAPAAKS